MKILVICQHYYPEPFRITDICEELVSLGHDVTVVSGTPNYPMGEIYPGYEKGKKSDEVINGVKVHRCKIAPRKTGVINRFRNYLSYARASKKYVKNLDGDFDVVFINQLSPVMMAKAGIAYSRKHKKKSILYCLDLWPESLCAGGIKSGSIIYKIFNRVSKKIYRSVDEILITSNMFEAYLIKHFDIDKNIIHYLPQYSESQFLDIKEKQQGEQFHLLFAGNIGAAQGVETIIDAAKELVSEQIVFHIVGDGIQLESLKLRAEGLENVKFYGRKPIEEMPDFYSKADAMMVTYADDSLSFTLPGKVQTYMAAGKPIVGAINGETAIVLQKAQGGYCANARDIATFVKYILDLKNSGKAVEIGNKNRQFYIDNFSKDKFFADLQKHLS